MKRAVNRMTFVLTWVCLLGLTGGLIYEARIHALIFNGYISTFFGWASTFAIINHCTRPSPAEPSILLPDSD
jgi:hypothetical protein